MRSVIELLLRKRERVVGDGARVELAGEHQVALRGVRVRRPPVRAYQHVSAEREAAHAYCPASAVHHV